MNREQLVYFIEGEGTGRVKIGVSHDPTFRLASLQAGSPVALHLRGVLPGGVAVEQALHLRFAEQREHGEWFRLTGELVDVVASARPPAPVPPPVALVRPTPAPLAAKPRPTPPMTAAQVAGRLKVSRKTVYRWIAEGRLPTVTIPSGRRRVPADALEAALAQDAT